MEQYEEEIMAAKQDLYIDQGTTFNTNLTLTDVNGNPMNLTGYTAYSQMKKWYSSTANATFTFTTSIPNPNNGVITMSVNANVTSTMWPGRYVYDIDIVDPNNNVTRVVEGFVTISPGVTNPPGITNNYE
jgi:hypothetical protein